MGKQRCLVCYQIKDSSYFASTHRSVCRSCISPSAKRRTHECLRCYRKISEIDERGYCMKCASLVSIQSLKPMVQKEVHDPKKQQVVKRICSIVRKHRVQTVLGFEELCFTDLTAEALNEAYKLDDLELLLETLEDLYSPGKSKESIEKLSSQPPSLRGEEIERKQLIYRILAIAEEYNVKKLRGFEKLDFQNLTYKKLDRYYMTQELQLMLIRLEGKSTSATKAKAVTIKKAQEHVVPPFISQDERDAKREQVIHEIMSIVEEKQIREVPGFYELDLSNINQYKLEKAYSMRQLEELLEVVQEMDSFIEEDIINPIEVLAKYTNAIFEGQRSESSVQRDESWRKQIPVVLKQIVQNWQTCSLEEIYETAKEQLHLCEVEHRHLLRNFLADMSRIIFEEQEDEEEEEIVLQGDEMADAVMKIVEMVILPHLEVLDRLKDTGGRVLHVNVWEQQFKESLKQEVKDRDGWHCVICEAETDLHVHHRIPRDLGGPNHRDNLVTVCASCHKAVETADIQQAFQTCWANYKRNRTRKSLAKAPMQDKNILREEVEQGLETLRIMLDHRDELKLAQEVEEIQKKLSVIFYE